MIGVANSYIFSYVPLGLIVPYYTADAVPSGWALFDSADGKYITGADSGDADYSVGAHSGTDATFDVVTSDEGKHLGDGETVRLGNLPGQYPGPPIQLEIRKGANKGGEHSHTITYTPTLGYEQMRFIKSTENHDKFPANSLVLTSSILTPPSGVTQQIVVADSAHNRFLKSNTSITTAYTSVSPACSTDGDHDHDWVTLANTAFERGEAGSSEQVVVITGPSDTDGDHAHTFASSSITENVSKVYLAAWTNAAEDFKGFSGTIALWESFTPPAGWVLCDGNNGTKDLKKRFVIFGPNASVGQYQGNGTITLSSSLDSNNFSHTHMNKDDYLASRVTGTVSNVNHDTESVPHTHTVDASTVEFLPDYYSLVFIQKL
jgi:hypothetical protein